MQDDECLAQVQEVEEAYGASAKLPEWSLDMASMWHPQSQSVADEEIQRPQSCRMFLRRQVSDELISWRPPPVISIELDAPNMVELSHLTIISQTICPQ